MIEYINWAVQTLNWPVLGVGLAGAAVSAPVYGYGRSIAHWYALWGFHAILAFILALTVPAHESAWVMATLALTHGMFIIATTIAFVCDVVQKWLWLRQLEKEKRDVKRRPAHNG